MPRIMIDNDVLSILCEDEPRTRELFGCLRNRGTQILLPATVLDENYRGGRGDMVANRFEVIGRLFHEFGSDRFIIFSDVVPKILEREVQTGGRLSDVPTVFETNALAREFLNKRKMMAMHSSHKDYRAESRARAESLHEVDRQIKESLKIPFEECDRRLRGFTGVNGDRTYVGMAYQIWHGLLAPKTAFSRKKYKSLVYSPTWTTMKAFSNLLIFRHLCNLFPPSSDAKIASLQTLNRNDWKDIEHAAVGAYCDFFVTNDNKLRAFCEHLKEVGALPFSSVDLNGLLQMSVIR